MNKALLDTDILSEVSKGINPVVVGNARTYRKAHGFLTHSVTSVMEAIQRYQRTGAANRSKGEWSVYGLGPRVQRSGCRKIAKALASELRQHHKLPAYIYQRFRKGEGPFDEVAVLVGTAMSLKENGSILKQVRAISPRRRADMPAFTRPGLTGASRITNPLLPAGKSPIKQSSAPWHGIPTGTIAWKNQTLTDDATGTMFAS